MKVRILGSAAGGGLPQWNCLCLVCRAARRADGSAIPRTQSSIAVSDGADRWLLVNASPDLRAQLTSLPLPEADGPRSTPVAGVLLTDAEIDHTAGLLLLRESGEELRVYSTAAVRSALSDGFPLLRMLGSYSGVAWTELKQDEPLQLPGSTLEVETFDVGGDAPLYVGENGAETSAVGLTFTDREGGQVLTYVPGLARLDEQILARFSASDCLLVDGTFWSADELVRLGIGRRRAEDMGHLPLAPPTGTLPTLGGLRTRTILVHINNTNPILLEGSPERATVEAAGVEVGYDGMEIELS
jgi:pyrroloquinoline quinone biosynthesis protein B